MSWTNSLSVLKLVTSSRRCASVITSEKQRTVNAAIAVLVGLADHLVDLVVSKLLADGGHDVAQLSGGNETVVITVENLNRSVNSSPYPE